MREDFGYRVAPLSKTCDTVKTASINNRLIFFIIFVYIQEQTTMLLSLFYSCGTQIGCNLESIYLPIVAIYVYPNLILS